MGTQSVGASPHRNTLTASSSFNFIRPSPLINAPSKSRLGRIRCRRLHSAQPPEGVCPVMRSVATGLTHGVSNSVRQGLNRPVIQQQEPLVIDGSVRRSLGFLMLARVPPRERRRPFKCVAKQAREVHIMALSAGERRAPEPSAGFSKQKSNA